MAIPHDFVRTVNPAVSGNRQQNPLREGNPQTDVFLAMLGLEHTVTVPSLVSSVAPAAVALDPDPVRFEAAEVKTTQAEIALDDDDDDQAPAAPVADSAEIALDDDDDEAPTPVDNAEIALDDE